MVAVAAYGCLMTERLIAINPGDVKRDFIERNVSAPREHCIPRGSPDRAASREPRDHDTVGSAGLRTDRTPRSLLLPRPRKRKATFRTE